MTKLNQIRAVISDMDGVLWRGETPLPGVAEFFGGLRQRQIPFVLATNNATATFSDVVGRLGALGMDLRQIAGERESRLLDARGDDVATQAGPPGQEPQAQGGRAFTEKVADAADGGLAVLGHVLGQLVAYQRYREARIGPAPGAVKAVSRRRSLLTAEIQRLILGRRAVGLMVSTSVRAGASVPGPLIETG